MTTRVRLEMIWTVMPSHVEGTPFSKIEDFFSYAKMVLETPFENYKSELKIEVKQNFSNEMYDISLVWDVNLDGVRGAWHSPRDHEKLALSELKTSISKFGRRLQTKIFRLAEEGDCDGATGFVEWDDEYPDRKFEAFMEKIATQDAKIARETKEA